METKEPQTLTEKHILMLQEIAGLKIQLETALLLLNASTCALSGAQAEKWLKMYQELLEEVAK